MLNLLTATIALRGVPTEALLLLADRGNWRMFPAGTELMREGEEGDCLHVIVRGQVVVQRGQDVLDEPLILAKLGPGEIAGEMALLSRAPRSATVTAIEDTETIEVDRAALAEASLHYPELLMALLRLLVQRIRSAEHLVEALARAG